MEKKWHKHFGIYGLVEDEKKVLLINKVKGSYSSKYDLPGGGIKEDESLVDNLKREFLEETAYEIKILSLHGVYDILIDESYKNFEKIHHIGIVYKVDLGNHISKVEEEVEVYGKLEKNDSSGIIWVDIDSLNEENSSPLVLKAIKNRKLEVEDITLFP